MDNKQFEYLTEPRDRRGEEPVDFELTDDAEFSAYQMHEMWRQEANQFGSPEDYARYKLPSTIVPVPEPLREIVGGWSLNLLSDEKWSQVAKLAEADAQVWEYVRMWITSGLVGSPMPDSLPNALLPVLRLELRGERKGRSKRPTAGYPDEVLRDVADQIRMRFGCGPFSKESLDALIAVTELSAETLIDKLKDAGKGTGKKSYRKKLTKRDKRQGGQQSN